MNNYRIMLPEDCLSTIFSFTTPEDAFSSTMVSSAFRSAIDSDVVWERFLPQDYPEIVSNSVNPLEFPSKKQLYQCLCDPVLIDGGHKIFKLEKSSGKKSFILSAEELSITWSSNPLYWSWIPMAESRFSKVAVLRTADWLEIRGRFRTKMLTPNTTYGAYLIMKISKSAYGLDSITAEMSVGVGNQVCSNTSAFIQQPESKKQMGIMKLMASERRDGWMEIEIGEFFNGDDDEDINMSFTEVKGCHLKGGLVIEGIELRPKL